MLTRRSLLASAAVGAAASLVAGCTGGDGGPAVPTTVPGLDPNDWASVRAQFTLKPGVAHFAAFVFASHPANVREAIDRHRAGLDADPHGYLDENEAALDHTVYNAAQAYLGVGPEQVALTDSTTMGLGLLYTGLRLKVGEEILTTEHDFYSTHESLRLRTERDGAVVKRVRLYDQPENARADEIVARLKAAVTPATRIVAVTWVHSSSGVKLPIRAIADMLAEVNRDRPDAEKALLCVDGVHGFGVEGTPPTQLGCDFLVSGCHKWLFGPRGTGLVWGRPEAWKRYTPVIPSFESASIVAWLNGSTPASIFPTPGGYHSFEHRWALTQAFSFHLALTPERVAQRSQALATALKDGLANIPGVRLRTPRGTDLSAGVVCCEVDSTSARMAVNRLQEMKVLASVTPYNQSFLRFGTSILTNESDVDKALAAVRSL